MKRWQITVIALLIIVGLIPIDGGGTYVKQLVNNLPKSQAIYLPSEFYPVPEPVPAMGNVTIAADYHFGFNRWNETTQTPELGKYVQYTSTVADWNIKWAVEHGIGVFSMQQGMPPSIPKSGQFQTFLKAKYIRYIKFAVHLVDWRPSDEVKANLFDRVLDVAEVFNHECYYRIDGKPVLFVGSIHRYRQIFGEEVLEQKIAALRKELLARGYAVYLIGSVVTGAALDSVPPRSTRSFDAVFEWGQASPFNVKPVVDSSGIWIYRGYYDDVVYDRVGVYKRWSMFAKTLGLKFVPTVMPNFNGTDPVILSARYRSVVLTGSGKVQLWELLNATPQGFRTMCEEARKNAVESDMVYVWTWNEFHERTNVEPTREYGFTYLDVIRDVFVGKADGHVDITPKTYAQQLMSEAGRLIESAKTEGRTSGLVEAEKALDKAHSAFESSSYGEAAYLANDARMLTQKANTPLTLYGWISANLAYITVSVAIVAGGIVLFARKRKTKLAQT